MDAARIAGYLEELRERTPLVTNITNYVVTNTTANALLAIGASPIMTHAVEEMEELVAISSALVINMGTVARTYVEGMPVAWAAANKHDVPVVLDPVGAGASKLRTDTPLSLLSKYKPAIIRGNASEIMTLAGEAGEAKGVDSTQSSNEALDGANRLARKQECAVCISGAVDVITDGERNAFVSGGHAMMPQVTGLGCTASALCAAFAPICDDYFEAAVCAMVVMSVAGEIAAEKADGPGTLQLYLYDAFYNLSLKDFEERMSLEIV